VVLVNIVSEPHSGLLKIVASQRVRSLNEVPAVLVHRVTKLRHNVVWLFGDDQRVKIVNERLKLVRKGVALEAVPLDKGLRGRILARSRVADKPNKHVPPLSQFFSY